MSSTAFLPIHFPVCVSLYAHSCAAWTWDLAFTLFPSLFESDHPVLGPGLGPCYLSALCAGTAHGGRWSGRVAVICFQIFKKGIAAFLCPLCSHLGGKLLWCIIFKEKPNTAVPPGDLLPQAYSTLFSVALPSLSRWHRICRVVACTFLISFQQP